MQLVGNKQIDAVAVPGWTPLRSLMTLRKGERGVLREIRMPEEVAYRLMLLGFVPGAEVESTGAAPGGDPLLFRVDGTEVAFRRETAEQIFIDAE